MQAMDMLALFAYRLFASLADRLLTVLATYFGSLLSCAGLRFIRFAPEGVSENGGP